MAKLKTLRPVVSTIKPLVGREAGEKARDKHREETQPWRQWYHSAEWKALRLVAFRRDKYRCQRTGELCIGKRQQPNAPVANHKVPHKGDRRLFFDLDNIETVSKAAHDSLIQKEEKSGYLAGSGIDGRPADPGHPWNLRRPASMGESHVSKCEGAGRSRCCATSENANGAVRGG